MAKQKTIKPETNKKGLLENDPSLSQPESGILAKHRIKVLKNAGISKTKDQKKTVTVVNPTPDLDEGEGGTEEAGW